MRKVITLQAIKYRIMRPVKILFLTISLLITIKEAKSFTVVSRLLSESTTVTSGGVTSSAATNVLNLSKTIKQGGVTRATYTYLADGAKIFLHEIAPGRFNAVVEGNKGIITTMSNWSQSSISRIARNYGWTIK